MKKVFSLKKAITVCCLDNQISKYELAELLNVNRHQVMRWQRTNKFNSDKINELADVFNMDLSEFISTGMVHPESNIAKNHLKENRA